MFRPLLLSDRPLIFRPDLAGILLLGGENLAISDKQGDTLKVSFGRLTTYRGIMHAGLLNPQNLSG